MKEKKEGLLLHFVNAAVTMALVLVLAVSFATEVQAAGKYELKLRNDKDKHFRMVVGDEEGATARIEVYKSGEIAFDSYVDKNLKIKSSNPSVVKVRNGSWLSLKAEKAGTTTITYTLGKSKLALKCTVVNDLLTVGSASDGTKSYGTVGDKLSFYESGKHFGYDVEGKVTYSVSNTKIAKLSKIYGMPCIKAIAPGTVTVIAKNGKATVKEKVVIYPKLSLQISNIVKKKGASSDEINITFKVKNASSKPVTIRFGLYSYEGGDSGWISETKLKKSVTLKKGQSTTVTMKDYIKGCPIGIGYKYGDMESVQWYEANGKKVKE